MRQIIKCFAIVVICLLVILIFQKTETTASKNHKISGWAWSENIGWLSLNCYNEGILNKCLQSDYGVDYKKETGEVSGWAWSEYAGWLCFGSNCKPTDVDSAPDASQPSVKISSGGLLSGWALWTVLENDGWLKLQGAEVSPVGDKYSCRNCAKLKNETTERCGFCFVKTEFSGSDAICGDCKKCGHGQCSFCAVCYSYGVGLDYGNNTLAGWAWNNGENSSGFGWLQFHPQQTQVEAHAPYLETIGGDVYGQAGVGSLYQGAAPEGKYNATYLVSSDGSIIHFSSMCEKTGNCDPSTGWETDRAGKLTFPKKETGYKSEIGKIDVAGLLAGQYGEVISITSGSQIKSTLSGKVYYSNADLNVPYKYFFNGTGEKSGAGTVVVRGDLYIKSNLSYQSPTINNLKQLASIGWIVLKKDDGTGGNIYFDAAVKKSVGSFYAENKIYTGTAGADKNDAALEISGLMAASGFSWQRNSFNLETKEPSERVIYDGRVIANPPPGFGDLAKSLPKFTQGE